MPKRLLVALLGILGVGGGALLAAPTASAAPDPGSGTDSDPTVVRTEQGRVRGTLDGDVLRYRGIPYAAPPVGDLRWREPEPAKPWQGVRDATRSAEPCAQKRGELPEDNLNEDCLYLDVTAPAGATDEPRPVILWLHGGGFYMGAGSSYDAKRLVTGADAVVVTINYRLGLMGNLGLPGLEGSGSFGLADQQAAMRWVQRNVAAFGGDPGNVTLAGQSAGAVSACAHLTSPGATGLFDKVIMQSGSCGTEWAANTVYRGQPADSILLPVETVAERGVAVATELGCDAEDPGRIVECLRALPMEALLPVVDRFIQPAYGNRVLPMEPGLMLRLGLFHRVPVLSGHTRDETTLPISMYEGGTAPMSEETFEAVMAETFGADEAAVAAEYPRSEFPSGAATWAAITTDRKWALSQYQDSVALSRYVPVHQYEFADPAPPFSTPAPMRMGAYHTSDLWYLFDLGGHAPPLTAEQEELSEQMIAYWGAFAATGDPGDAGGPAWPAFEANGQHDRRTPYVQRLAPGPDGIGRVDVADQHHLDLWRELTRDTGR